MCGSKNFRRVHARVCVWMGEEVHQAKQTVEEIQETFLRWGWYSYSSAYFAEGTNDFFKEN